MLCNYAKLSVASVLLLIVVLIVFAIFTSSSAGRRRSGHEESCQTGGGFCYPAGVHLHRAVLLCADTELFDPKRRKENLDLQLIKQKDQVEGEYFSALEDQYERQRVLLHDLRRHLTAIKEFALENDDQHVARYVSDLQNLPALQRKLKYCGNITLNVVLSRYKELCDEKSIQFSVDVRDVDVDFLAQNDITALFGNLLENAVEAAENSKKPYIELIVGSNGDTHTDARLFVSLTNSSDEEPLKDSAGNFLTHKLNRERHGMGQKSIKRAVKKYDGNIEQQYDKETRLFHASILF